MVGLNYVLSLSKLQICLMFGIIPGAKITVHRYSEYGGLIIYVYESCKEVGG